MTPLDCNVCVMLRVQQPQAVLPKSSQLHNMSNDVVVVDETAAFRSVSLYLSRYLFLSGNFLLSRRLRFPFLDLIRWYDNFIIKHTLFIKCIISPYDIITPMFDTRRFVVVLYCHESCVQRVSILLDPKVKLTRKMGEMTWYRYGVSIDVYNVTSFFKLVQDKICTIRV